MTAAQYDAIARKLLRAELAARGARDLDLAEAYVAPTVRFDPDTGEHVGTVDRSGNPLISHKRDGAPPMNLDEVLAETMRAKPELFGGASVAPGRVGQPATVNPFAQGPGFNLTLGMKLFREDEGHARELMRQAGYDTGVRR